MPPSVPSHSGTLEGLAGPWGRPGLAAAPGSPFLGERTDCEARVEAACMVTAGPRPPHGAGEERGAWAVCVRAQAQRRSLLGAAGPEHRARGQVLTDAVSCPQFAAWVDAVVFVFSLEDEISFQTVYNYYLRLCSYRNTAEVPMVLVGTQGERGTAGHPPHSPCPVVSKCPKEPGRGPCEGLGVLVSLPGADELRQDRVTQRPLLLRALGELDRAFSEHPSFPGMLLHCTTEPFPLRNT